MASEKQFENKIKQYLKDHDIWFVKYFANRNTKSGIPDILACVNGYFVAIEVKAENGEPTPLQLHNIGEIRKGNGIAIVLYPSQFKDFKLMIEDLLYRPSYHETVCYEQREFDKKEWDVI